jgi:SSS family solute:Na+ symporter
MKQMAGGGIYKYLQAVQGYLAPPITAVFLLGLFWRRINATGAFYGLVVGFALGMTKLIIEAIASQKGITTGPLSVIAEFNFLYYSGVLLVISTVIIIALSFMTDAPTESQTRGLTWRGLSAEDKLDIKNSWNKWDVMGTCVVLGLVLGMYLYFSFWLK